MKAHEVRALIGDPVTKARMRIDEEIRQTVLHKHKPVSVTVTLLLSPAEAEELNVSLYADGFSCQYRQTMVGSTPYYRFVIIWHKTARTVRGPLASNTITDTGPVKTNGDRQ